MGLFNNILDKVKSAAGSVAKTFTKPRSQEPISPYAVFKTKGGSGTFAESTPYASSNVMKSETQTNPFGSIQQSLRTNPAVGAASSGGTIRAPNITPKYSITPPSGKIDTGIPMYSTGSSPSQTAPPVIGQTVNPNLGNESNSQRINTNYGDQNSSVSTPRTSFKRGGTISAPEGYYLRGTQAVPLPQAPTGDAGVQNQVFFGSGGQSTSLSGVAGQPGVQGGMSNFLGITGTGNTGSTGPLGTQEEDETVRDKRPPTLNSITPFNIFNTPAAPPEVMKRLDASVPPEITVPEGEPTNYNVGTKEEFDLQVNQGLTSNYEKAKTENSIPEGSVEETPEQTEFIESQEDPYSVRAAVDQIKISNGQPELLQMKSDGMAQLQAINETYQAVIDDIKGNPDLPKALAQRRLNAVMEEWKTRQQQAVNMIETAQAGLDQIDALIAQEFQIANFEENKRNRDVDNQRQMLNMLISSGAIAGYSDEELAQLANQVGVSVNGLQKVRDSYVSGGNTQAALDELAYEQTAASAFSPTQLATGAANSGLDIDDFKMLDKDVANQFIKGGMRSQESYIQNYTTDELLDMALDPDEGLYTDELEELAKELGVKSMWKSWEKEVREMEEKYPMEIVFLWFEKNNIPTLGLPITPEGKVMT